ncbi:hypothetical protein OVA07_14005 [Novosphingobium sp. SL115]|uniref:hypothetical protein n=1 Tax=Novosphingobium sp. SL115 TaxID=2995150 RepID=UPI002276CC2C|nr:hypothetical protein [Novosphingobium sp. SL115]MCY1672117.1 hypothetical protein [Novosphingobium sp. SL115]
MQTTIGKLDRATGTVPVTFEQNGKRHLRAVNAVIDADGRHDRAATRTRVEEVAQGVAHKFALGLLGNSSVKGQG